MTSFPEKDWSRLSQEQREAVFDLLTLTLFADRHVALDEEAFLEQAALIGHWNSRTTLEQYLRQAIQRARAPRGAPANEAYLEEIRRRLSDEVARRLAVSICRQLAWADGHYATSEAKYLAKLEIALGLA